MSTGADWAEGLSPERVAEVVQVSDHVRDIHASAVNTWGIAPARVVSEVAMLALSAIVQVKHLEQRLEEITARLPDDPAV